MKKVIKQVEIKVDFEKAKGKFKAMHGIGQPPMTGLSNSMFHYLKEAGIPYSRLHDVGGAYGRMVYVDVPNIFRNFDADEKDPANYDFAFTDRLMDALAEMFSEVLRPQDRLVLLPVYDAGGTADRSVNSDVLAEKVAGSIFVKTPEEAEGFLRAQASAFGAIVTAGARDPALPVMACHLAGKE